MLNTNLKISISQRSKNYGSPTPVSRLKVAVNMADPISIVENSSWYTLETIVGFYLKGQTAFPPCFSSVSYK